MAKTPGGLHKDGLSRPRGRRRTKKKSRRWPLRLAKFGAALALVLYLAACYLLLGPSQPALLQWLLGVVCVGMTVGVYLLATKRTGPTPETILQRHAGQHVDFGRRRREALHQRELFCLPLVGEVKKRTIGAVVVGILMSVWWLTPWAPVVTRPPAVADLTGPVGDEILAVALALPDANLIMLQPPVVPNLARQLAKEIDLNDTNQYRQALKAMAENRYEDARGLLALAMRNEDATAAEIHLARAQNELLSGHPADALQWYQNLVQTEVGGNPRYRYQMAVAAMHAGDFVQAATLVQQALKVCETGAAAEGDPLALAIGLHLRAVVAVAWAANWAQAEIDCRDAREIFEHLGDHTAPIMAASLNNQAVLYKLRSNLAGAEELVGGARDIWALVSEVTYPAQTTSLTNRAMLACNLAHYAQAQEDLGIAPGLLPDGNVPAPLSLQLAWQNVVANVELQQGHYAAAEAMLDKVLAAAEASVHEDDLVMAAILNTVGDLHVAEALYPKAELFYLRSQEVNEKIWGPQHPLLIDNLNDLARVYIAQKRFDEAEQRCQRALEIAEKQLGDKHPLVARTLHTRGLLEIGRQQPLQARPYLEEAASILKEAFGKEHPDWARVEASLASLDTSPRTYNRAVASYEQAIASMRQHLGEEHPEVGQMLFGLAKLHVFRGKYPEAEKVLDQALAVQVKSLPPHHPDLATTLEGHSWVLRRLEPPQTERADEQTERAKKVRSLYDQQLRQQ